MEQENKIIKREGEEPRVILEEEDHETLQLPGMWTKRPQDEELGVFQFPWGDENYLVLDGWNSCDENFYSSLADQITPCSYEEDLCDRRLSPPSPVVLPEEEMEDEWWVSEEDHVNQIEVLESLDQSMWSSAVLGQPSATNLLKE